MDAKRPVSQEASETDEGGPSDKSLMDKSANRQRAAVIVLLAVVLARLGFSFLIYARPDLSIHPDSALYQQIADELVSGKAYQWNTHAPPELLRTIGYPAFLALIQSSLGSAPGNVALVQLALSGAMVLVAYLHFRGAVGTVPAFIAALMLAVDPLTIFWSLRVLSETLSTLLLFVSVVFVARWAESQRAWNLVAGGAVLGLCCLVRPIAQALAVVWALAIFVFPRPKFEFHWYSVWPRLRRSLLFLMPIVVLIAPWVVRNALLWNCPTLSSVDRYTLRDWMAAEVISEYQHIPLNEAVTNLYATDPGMCPRRTADYLRIIVAHPLIYAKLQVAGTIPVLLGTSFDQWFQLFGVTYQLPDLWRPYLDDGPQGVWRVLQAQFLRFPPGVLLMGALTVFQLMIYVLALLGVLSLNRIPSPPARWTLFVLAAAILILLISPGPDGHERFRVPAQPLMIYLAGYGVAVKAIPLLRRSPSSKTT